MKIKHYVKTVDKQLKDVNPKEKRKILSHLRKKLKSFMEKKQKKVLVEKLGNPVDYGKALNTQYKLMKTTDNIRLAITPTNGKRNLLKEMKFIISADMIMPVPTHTLWVLGGISLGLIAFFVYLLYIWNMWIQFWILTPAFVANGAALFSRRIKFLQPLAIPIDNGRKMFDGKRIIGNSKTVRGFVFGIFAAILAALVIFYASEYFRIQIFSSLIDSALIGLVVGFGALLGDTVKSFFKRRIGFTEGKNLLFFDQLDFLIGAILISLPFEQLSIPFIAIIITATFLLHVLTNVIAFYMRFKRVPW